MHTCPLAQPGTADAGGMNVYVRELATALARSGVRCEVYTRLEDPRQPGSAWVEPCFRIHHISAGPVAPVPKELLPGLVGEWTAGVAASLAGLARDGEGVDLLHANYWLSAVAGHSLKHALDLPLVCSFHTLDRVKAEAEGEDASAAAKRAGEEAAAIGCSDAVLASCSVEADQLVNLYQASPGRVEILAPGVDRAFFGPGNQAQARRAVGLPEEVPVVLFVGRNPTAQGAFAGRRGGRPAEGATRTRWAGHPGRGWRPERAERREELARAKALMASNGLGERVHFVPPQPHELLSTYYRAADVCVVPSRSESFGLVALEAASCALPVVASTVGGLTTLVHHGRTGYLVENSDATRFAHYLGEILDDRSLARCLGAAACDMTRGYTWALAASRMRRLCTTLAQRELVSCG